MKSFKLTLLALAAFTFVFSGCKYEEGPGISFRTKKDRLANEWKVTGYEIDGNEDAAAKNSFRSSGDSVELIFTMTRNNNYALNMAYVDGYVSPSGDKLLSPNATDSRAYYDILGAFSVNNKLVKKISQGGKYSFDDRYRKVIFGANGTGDMSYPEGGDTSRVSADIIMLKNKMLKLEFEIESKKHRITFEPKNPEIIKKD